MAEHPHQGVIQAVAQFSAAYASIDCGYEALVEDGIAIPDGPDPAADWPDPRVVLAELADTVMEPFGVANVLQTVEEWLVDSPSVPGFGYEPAPEDRLTAVIAIADAALAARQDERDDASRVTGLWIEVDPRDRQRAGDALFTLASRVLVEPGENPDTGHARILLEGHDFDEELIRSTLQLAEGGEVVIHSIGAPAPAPIQDAREAEHA